MKAVQNQDLTNPQCETGSRGWCLLEVIHSELSSSLYQLLLAGEMHFPTVGHDDVHLMVWEKVSINRGTRGALTCGAVRLCCEQFLRSLKSFQPRTWLPSRIPLQEKSEDIYLHFINATEGVCIVEGFISEANCFWHLSQIWGWIQRFFNLLKSSTRDTGAFQYAGSLLKCSPWAWHYCAFSKSSSSEIISVFWRSSCCKVCGVFGICPKFGCVILKV